MKSTWMGRLSQRMMLVILTIAAGGCGGIDRSSLRATSDVPRTVIVEDISVPRDPSRPFFGIVVQPEIDVVRTLQPNRVIPPPRSYQLMLQLNSALTGIGNFRVLSAGALSMNSSGTMSYRDRREYEGVTGPIVLRARLTEFEAESERDKSRVDVGVYNQKRDVIRGTAAIDVQAIDGRTGRVIAAFPARASFGSEEQERGTGILPVHRVREMAQSMVDQALRKASQDAALELWKILRDRR